MPAYYRLTFEGTLGASPEVFSIGIAYQASASIPTQASMDLWAENVRTLFATPDAGSVWIKSNLSLASSVTRVRLYYYANVGDPAFLTATSTGAAVPGAGALVHPPQCATVVSLATGFPGPSNRGRFYVPMLAGAVGSSLKRTDLSGSTATNVAASLRAYGGTASGGLSTGPAVVSQSKGTVTPVTSVRIGDVVDTQRRRRDALTELYVSASIPP